MPDRTRLVLQIALALNVVYLKRHDDSLSIVSSIEMAEAALKAIDDARQAQA